MPLNKKVEALRKDGENIFIFNVSDPEQAFTAALDVPRLFSIGHRRQKHPEGAANKWAKLLHTFATTGFPCTDKPGCFIPQLCSGSPGAIGASYRYSFPTDKDSLGHITVETQIAAVTNQDAFKEVVFRHANAGRKVKSIRYSCFEHPVPVKKSTKTQIRFCKGSDGTWTCTLKFDGFSMFDPTEVIGAANYWCMVAAVGCTFPCLLPFLPCMVASDFDCPAHVTIQLSLVKKYFESYPEALEKPVRTNRRGEVIAAADDSEETQIATEATQAPFQEEANIPTAIPVATEEDAKQSRAEELGRWFRLYEQGAISKAEYDVEKLKVLRVT